MKKLFVMLLTVSASVVAFAQSASFREFTYNGKTYRGEVLQVVPATVKIRSEDGRIATFAVDQLDLNFAAGLDIPNSPYKALLGARPALGQAAAPVSAQRQNQPPAKSLAEKQIGDVKIEIVSASISQVEFKDMFGETKRSSSALMIFRIRVTNTSTTKKLNYETWRGKMMSFNQDFASLKDDFGNLYKRIDFTTKTPADSVNRNASIYPESSVMDSLVYEVPVDSAKSLTLEMPGANIGLQKPVSFVIPMQDVSR